MDKQEKYTEDLLSQYINPERIEKAPEGFTINVMSAIEKEEAPVRVSGIIRKRTLVPYVFSGFILILFVAAIFLPAGESNSPGTPVLEFLKSIKITLPDVDLGSLFSVDIPPALLYGFLGILLLSFLDRALSGVFHK